MESLHYKPNLPHNRPKTKRTNWRVPTIVVVLIAIGIFRSLGDRFESTIAPTLIGIIWALVFVGFLARYLILMRNRKFSEAIKAFDCHEYDTAIRLMSIVARRRIFSRSARANLIFFYFHVGKLEEAEVLLRKLHIRRNEWRLLYVKGCVLQRFGDHAHAIQSFVEVMRYQQFASLYVNLAFSQWILGEPISAISNVFAAMEIDADDPDLYFFLGSIYTSTGDFIEAERYYRNYLMHERELLNDNNVIKAQSFLDSRVREEAEQ